MKNKKIIITGGAGFIGSHLCQKLLQLDNTVICIDNLLTGKKNNITNLFGNKNFTFINHDINYQINIKSDFIFHLACPASPKHYQKDPVNTLITNINGTYNILKLAKKYNSRIIFTSTSEVYGDPDENPQKESYNGNVNPIGLRSCYDEGKRAAESLCFDFNRKYKTKIKILRLFNTYGPLMFKDDGRVVSNFIFNALRNKPIKIYGNGKQTRSLCFIDDLITGLIKIANLSDNVKGPLNIGNDQEITINDLCSKILKITNSKSKIIHTDLPEDDPKMRKPDLTKIKKLINWKPKVSLNDGLLATVNYFKKL